MKNIPLGIILLILIWKISVISISLFAPSLIPFNSTVFKQNFIYPKNQKVNLTTSLKTWDAQHYLYLSSVGYKADQDSNAFYPLYPLTIKLVNFLIHNNLISGLMVSNISSFVALLLLYILVRSKYNETIAFSTLVLFLAFPTSFYLNLVYSEGLFLLLLTGFIVSIEKKNYYLSSLCAFLIPMTRSVGVLIEIPLLAYLLLSRYKGKKITIPTFNEPVSFRIHLEYLLLIIPITGFLVNLIYMRITTGNFFAEFDAQRVFVGGYYLINLLNPALLFHNIFGVQLSLHGLTNSVFDRVFFGIFLIFMPIVYKKVERPLFYIYVMFWLVPLFGSFMGYMRYLLPVFLPAAIVISILLEKRKYLFFSLLFVMMMIQTLFIVLQALNYWVS